MKISITTGTLAPPLAQQLKSQNVVLAKQKVAKIQKALNILTWLIVNNFVGDVAAEKINLRILRKLMAFIKEETGRASDN